MVNFFHKYSLMRLFMFILFIPSTMHVTEVSQILNIKWLTMLVLDTKQVCTNAAWWEQGVSL